MNIDNFDYKIDPVIVQRGRKYYRSGAVTDFPAATHEGGSD